ncbi:hypothetical protein DFH28DRAFT_900806 [Melampsora americana]|nr:hypothetical protein DFH28DRAFT_900806 [Melampsora americana]
MSTRNALLEKRAANQQNLKESLALSTTQRGPTPPQNLQGPSSLIRERSLSIPRHRDTMFSVDLPNTVQYNSRSSSVEMESLGMPGDSSSNRERLGSIPRHRATSLSENSPAAFQDHSRFSSAEMEISGTSSIPRLRATSISMNSPASAQSHSRSSSVKMGSPAPLFIPSQRSTSFLPRSLYSMSHPDMTHLDRSGLSSVGVLSPPSVFPSQRSTPSQRSAWHSPRSLYSMPRQRSASISEGRSPYNMRSNGMSHSNISLEKSVNDTISSSSDEASSNDHIENLIEQAINDEVTHDEDDWEDVVYQGPRTSNQTLQQGAYKKNAQINDSWYPFGTMENVISLMCYGKARSLLSRTQYETVRSAISGQSRVWNDTKRVSEQVWNDTQKPNMTTKVDALQKSYGLKDTMLQPFVDKYRKLYRKDGPAQARVFASACESRLGDRMLNPFFKLDVLKHFFGGGLVCNETTGEWNKGGSKLEALQLHSKVIDNTFGFKIDQWPNILKSNMTHYKPGLQPHQERTTAQSFLSLHKHTFEVVYSTVLENGQSVNIGDFVGVRTPYQNPPQSIARIRTIWSPNLWTNDHMSPILSLECGSLSSWYHSFYGMRSLKIEPNNTFDVYLDEVRCSINVQHNCFDSKCQTGRAQDLTEHQICEPVAPLETHSHKDTNLFIVNSAALYNSQAHHEWAHIEPAVVTCETWRQAIQCGLTRWKEEGQRK